ncbi:MAG TPA: polysaccharide deacetylase family protein [Kofleriaceae bacterium]|nr:polysaccharide deacetylase family protein [Kofleriaceae bacterium]
MRAFFAAMLAALAAVPANAGAAHAGAAKANMASVATPKTPRAWPQPAAGPTMTGDPELIFTFDDGPDPKRTPFVLDTLAAHHIHAIFFLVGVNVDKPGSRELIDRMLREGHIVANHTMSHQDLCRLKEDERAAYEIDKGREVIESATHMQLAWFRVPYGARCERVDNMLAARGLTHFHWDLDPREWKGSNLKHTMAYLEKSLGKMTGRNVLLMHDIKKVTVEALPQILDWLDAENAKRREVRLRRIRIIQSWELAEERLPAGTIQWLGEAAPDPQGLAKAIASVLP